MSKSTDFDDLFSVAEHELWESRSETIARFMKDFIDEHYKEHDFFDLFDFESMMAIMLPFASTFLEWFQRQEFEDGGLPDPEQPLSRLGHFFVMGIMWERYHKSEEFQAYLQKQGISLEQFNEHLRRGQGTDLA
ncbi:MAG: hypothetical protein GYB68_02900 [Chloroflexi bacterium]|nr:hypothetical protein [Chloroflexota bacterium]